MKFIPDAVTTTPDVLTDVTNLVPTARGYRTAPGGVSAGLAALAAACTGAALLYRLDGDYRLIAGTELALYEGASGVWSDVSRGAAYSNGDAAWRFAQFGNTSLAINKATQLQYSNLGAFADVANAPKAACIETVQGFVMLANTDDSSTGLTTGFGDQPHRWWCSQAFNPLGTWAPNVATQANTGLLVDAPGAINALRRLGSECIAYKQHAMFVGRYLAGDPAVWGWSLVPADVGAPSHEAVVSIGNAHLFIGYENIYQFDGSRPVAIGDGVKEWFFARLNKSWASRIQGAHDYENGAVWWWYPSGSSETLDSALIYNYRTGKWGHATLTVEAVTQTVASGISYDNLGNYYATYDDLPQIAFDSPFWQSAAPLLSYIDASHVVQTLTGVGAGGSLVTGDVGSEDLVQLVDRVRMRFSRAPQAATLTGYVRAALTESLTSAGTSTYVLGRFDVLQAGHWHRFRVDLTGDCELTAILPRMVTEGEG